MNTPTTGHNNPPAPIDDPIDLAIAPYSDALSEAENWLDGQRVEDEDSMKAVDAIMADIRKAKASVAKAKKAATDPLHKAWKAEGLRWKPTEDDIEVRLKGLAAIVDPFKRKLAAEKEAAKRAAYAEAQRKEREAREAAEKADAANYAEVSEALAKVQEAKDAKQAASAANKDKVKGLRKVTKYEVTDYKALLHWLATNRKDDLIAFLDDWARRNHKTADGAAGLRVWSEKEAY